MKKGLILTVGNEMMGDDGAGPSFARRLIEAPLAGWTVIDGGTTPENCMHQVRDLDPERILVVDAADAGLEPGEIFFMDEAAIAELFLMSTHTLPLSFLIAALKEITPEVRFIGIQPDLTAFGFPMSESVHAAVETLYQLMAGEQLLSMLAEWEQGQAELKLLQFSE